MVELSVFGGTVLRRDGEIVDGRPAQRHHIALLALLAASPGCSATRDRLIGHLWPNLDESKARHRLSVALHVLRSGLREDCFVVAGDTIALNQDAVTSDLCAFQDAVEAGRLEEAVALYTGPFMDGFYLPDADEYEPWMDGERNRLGGMYRAVLERLVAEAERHEDVAASLAARRRLAAHARYDSSVAMGLMRALAASGDVAAAVSYSRAYATLVESELEMPVNPEVLKLADELVREGPRSAPRQEVAAVSPAPVPREAAPREAVPEGLPASALGRGQLRLARRIAGWAAAAVFVTIVAAGLLGRRSEAAVDAAGEGPAVDAAPLGGGSQQQQELESLARRVVEAMGVSLASIPDVSLSVGPSSPEAERDVPASAPSAWIIDARLRRDGSRTVVSVRLIDGPSGETRWSRDYERPTNEMESNPEEVAFLMAEDLRPRLTQ